MTRSYVLLVLGLFLLASSLALALDGSLRIAAIGRYTLASLLVLGPFVAVGAFVGRIAEGASIRAE
ncbi:MAG TPA: hypothetical protein VG755_17900 [Nannocystaceae bacterium]|nr:hypothetical protein [Nannocystaceae bacterium]